MEKQMPKRTLGKSGLTVSAIGLGCMRMTFGDKPIGDTQEMIRANQVVIDLLSRIAEQKGATPAQIALAWGFAQKPWIVPIPGSRKLERLDENIGAVAVELTQGDLREIDSAMANITVQGNRY